MKRILSLLLAAITLVSVFCIGSSAMTPYLTYTYSIDGTILESPDAYVPEATVVDSDYIGLATPLGDVRDVEVDEDENVYIVDAGSNRLVVTDSFYKLKFIIDTFVNEQGVPDTFNNPSGVFVGNGKIYVCDTSNSRIVIFYTDGTYYKTLQAPKSSLFEQGDIYSPVAVAVDNYGRLFVISSTTYQGIIVVDEDGNFFGFVGAQAATVSALQLLWRKFMSQEQIAQSEQIVATEYNNIDIDEGGFIYATISSIDESTLEGVITGKDMSSTYAPVKKFNANGNDVMYRTGFYPPAGEVQMGEQGPSKLIDVAIGPNDTWTTIDEKRSKIFTYNNQGELLFAFGDNNGAQIGNVKSVEAVVYQGSKLLVLDKGNSNLVVFRRTEYGDILLQAIVDQDDMQFDKAADNWKQILKRNNNFDIAYIGIGKYYDRAHDYNTAMKYFKAAHDTALYSDSYNEVRNDWMSKWFWTIPVGIVAVLLLASWGFRKAGEFNKKTSLKVGRKTFKEELVYITHVIFHPFDGFWDLKHERRGSVRAGIVIIAFTILAFFYKSIGTGYIFTGSDNSYDTIVSSILSVVLPVGLWVVSNWCLTTLMEGEGTFKDVFIATSYAIAPVGVIILITTIWSNFAVAGEGTLLTMINSVAFAWAGILLFFGTMVTHGYSFGKNLATVILTIIAMAFLMFLILLFSSLMGKIVSFISGIIVELNYRI